MSGEDLASRDCVPCKGGVPPLGPEAVRDLLARVPGWRAPGDRRLERTYRFPDFRSALAFTDRVGALAEEQNHHPDLHLSWGKVKVEIWTHKIGGLAESDFVFAAKVERLAT